MEGLLQKTPPCKVHSQRKIKDWAAIPLPAGSHPPPSRPHPGSARSQQLPDNEIAIGDGSRGQVT